LLALATDEQKAIIISSLTSRGERLKAKQAPTFDDSAIKDAFK
jgi:hypothetical protein